MFETLVALFVFFVGGALASYFVAKRVHAPLFAASAGEEDFVLDHEFTYLDALEALERRPLDKAELLALGKRYAVDEATPCGRVAITYAHEDGRFEYWSERSHIPYKTLDAVARRFCVENDCRALYVDMYEELYKQWAGVSRLAHLSPRSSSAGGGSSDDDYAHLFGDDKADDKDDDGKEEADSLLASFVRSPGGGLEADTETRPAQSVFASFKDYNAPALAIAQRQRQHEKKENIDDDNDDDDEAPMRNTFLRRGSMHDWEAMCRARATPERPAPSDARKETCGSWFSYAAFKAAQAVTRAKDEYEERRPFDGDDNGNSIGQIEMQPLLPKESAEAGETKETEETTEQSADAGEAGEAGETEETEETEERSAGEQSADAGEAGEAEETEETKEAGVNETKEPPSALFFDRLF